MIKLPFSIKPFHVLRRNYVFQKTVDMDLESRVANILPVLGGVIEAECVEDRIVAGNPWHYSTNVPWLVGVTSKELLFLYICKTLD